MNSPHCFTCREHEKIGKNKKECYCLALTGLTGKKDLIEEVSTGVCRAYFSLEIWENKIENGLMNK